jgi:hypothetical protein
MKSASVAGFLPTSSGFAFPNRFPSVPAWTFRIPALGEIGLGNAANGLCGGMVFAARDFFEFGVAPPAITDPPGRGSPLFKYIVDRLLASFDLPLGLARYYQCMRLTDGEMAAYTQIAWSSVRSELDAGKPAPLALVRSGSPDLGELGKNHQVLAYGYQLDEASGALSIDLYDPNHPGALVTMKCKVNAGAPLSLSYSTGESTRGFFLTPYGPADPRYLVAAAATPPPWWSRLLAMIGR